MFLFKTYHNLFIITFLQLIISNAKDKNTQNDKEPLMVWLLVRYK